jgi:hypothetical protein
MNEIMAGLANDERFASSFQHDLRPMRSFVSHAFQVSKFAHVMNNSVLTFDETKFALTRYESSYHLLLLIANGGRESINQNGLFPVDERDTSECSNQGFLSTFALFDDLQARSGAVRSLNVGTIAMDHCLLALPVFGCQRVQQRLLHTPVEPTEPTDIISSLIVLVQTAIFRLIGVQDGIIGLGRKPHASKWLAFVFVLGAFLFHDLCWKS